MTKRNVQDNYGKYTPEMVEWLKINFEKTKFDTLVEAFNKHFNTTFTKSALWHKTNRILDGQITRVNKYIPRTKWTNEMVNWLKENYNKYSYKKASEQINKIFNVKTTTGSVEHKVNRLGLKKDKEGLRASYNFKRASKFWFRRGRISPIKKPIGYERLDKKTGIIWIKTQDPDIFEAKHRVIYREHYGEIKEGMNIVFLNGNKQDYRIENLVALTNQELALFNTLKIQAKGIDEIGKEEDMQIVIIQLLECMG